MADNGQEADVESNSADAASRRWLRPGEGAGQLPVMFAIDEELARPTDTGRIAHYVISKLAPLGRHHALDDIRSAARAQLREFGQVESRAHLQNISGLVHRYFSQCLPPAGYIFGAAEVELGVGRPDLTWRTSDDRVLVDEIKTGSPRNVELARTREQIERYRTACLDVWGERYVGLRLIAVGDTARSVFVSPDGTQVPLSSTAHVWRGA